MDAVLGVGGAKQVDQPLSVLDNCRISWGQCFPATATDVEVLCRRLAWDGRALTLSEPSARVLEVWADGYSAVPDVAVGDVVAMHWARLCGRLRRRSSLADESTDRQLRVTGRRLARV